MKLDIFVSYLSQRYQPNNENKANAAMWIYHVWAPGLFLNTTSPYPGIIIGAHINDHKCFISKTHRY